MTYESASLRKHSTGEEIESFLRCRLDGRQALQVEQHLNSCTECHTRAVELMNQGLSIAPSLRMPVESSSVTRVKQFANGHDGTADAAPSGLNTFPTSGHGTRIAQYEIVRELGRGGMGIVFEAKDTVSNRRVAIKTMSWSEASGECLTRGMLEGRTLAALNHPNIVRIYEVLARPEGFFLVMELLEGLPLHSWQQGYSVGPHFAAELIAKLADAMQHAHDRGIIHRDIKPANIILIGDLVSPQSVDNANNITPIITDFGIAKLRTSGIPCLDTPRGASLGTPSYMAPEQFDDSTDNVDARADIYSLGTVLFELVTGNPAITPRDIHRSASTAHCRELVEQKLRDARAFLTRDMYAICEKCLSLEPGKRYESAQALAEDLRRLIGGHPVHAKPSSMPMRAWKWIRRNRRESIWIALSLGMLVLTTAGATWSITTIYKARLRSKQLQSRLEKTEQLATANWRVTLKALRKLEAKFARHSPDWRRDEVSELVQKAYRRYFENLPADHEWMIEDFTAVCYLLQGASVVELGVETSNGILLKRAQAKFKTALQSDDDDVGLLTIKLSLNMLSLTQANWAHDKTSICEITQETARVASRLAAKDVTRMSRAPFIGSVLERCVVSLQRTQAIEQARDMLDRYMEFARKAYATEVGQDAVYSSALLFAVEHAIDLADFELASALLRECKSLMQTPDFSALGEPIRKKLEQRYTDEEQRLNVAASACTQ